MRYTVQPLPVALKLYDAADDVTIEVTATDVVLSKGPTPRLRISHAEWGNFKAACDAAEARGPLGRFRASASDFQDEATVRYDDGTDLFSIVFAVSGGAAQHTFSPADRAELEGLVDAAIASI